MPPLEIDPLSSGVHQQASKNLRSWRALASLAAPAALFHAGLIIFAKAALLPILFIFFAGRSFREITSKKIRPCLRASVKKQRGQKEGSGRSGHGAPPASFKPRDAS